MSKSIAFLLLVCLVAVEGQNQEDAAKCTADIANYLSKAPLDETALKTLLETTRDSYGDVTFLTRAEGPEQEYFDRLNDAKEDTEEACDELLIHFELPPAAVPCSREMPDNEFFFEVVKTNQRVKDVTEAYSACNMYNAFTGRVTD